MTRTAAREIAVRLCFGVTENPKDPEELGQCSTEYYGALKGGDGVRLVSGWLQMITSCGSSEALLNQRGLDSYIEKYAVGWKFGRISGRP